MTPLQLLDFQQLPTILSHFDDFFGVFMGQERFSKAFFTNLLPLSPKGNGVLTFLQQSHKCFLESRPNLYPPGLCLAGAPQKACRLLPARTLTIEIRHLTEDTRLPPTEAARWSEFMPSLGGRQSLVFRDGGRSSSSAGLPADTTRRRSCRPGCLARPD
jgi:hypothetical protein